MMTQDMKSNYPDKMLQKHKTRKNIQEMKSATRFLITINVLGSVGPIRFVVNEEESVAGVIDSCLKLYAREKRLPLLGSDVNGVYLYPANAGTDALNPSQSIGFGGHRNFILCKKQRQPLMTEARSEMMAKKQSGSWRAWFYKSFSFKILSH